MSETSMSSIEARAAARKEAENAFYNDELERMAKERASMAKMAENIVFAIERAQARNDETSIQDISSADKMEELINKANHNKKSSLETLNDLSVSFEAMKKSSNYEKLLEELNRDNDDEEGKEGSSSAAENMASAERGKDDSSSSSDPRHKDIVPAHTLESEAKEQRMRLKEATGKLNKIFASGQKEYNELVLSMASGFDDGAQALDADIRVDGDNAEVIQEALVPMLQKKINHLGSALEMTTLKAEAFSLQLITDKAHFVEKENKLQRTVQALEVKLQVASNKKRFQEQIDRDPNMVQGVVSRGEYDEALQMLADAKEEAKKARAEAETVKLEFAALKTRAYEAERDKVDDKAKIAQMERELKNAAKAAEQVTELKSKVAEKEMEVMEAASEAAQWKQKFEAGTGKLEADIMREMNKVVAGMKAFGNQLGAQDSKATHMLDTQAARLTEAKRKIGDLGESLATQAAEVKEMQATAEAAAEAADLASQNGGVVDDLKAENERLRLQLEQKTQELDDQSATMEEQIRVATAASETGSLASAASGRRSAAFTPGGADDHREPMSAERCDIIVTEVSKSAQESMLAAMTKAGVKGSEEEAQNAITEHTKMIKLKASAFGQQLHEMGLEDSEIDELLRAYTKSLFEGVEKLTVQATAAGVSISGGGGKGGDDDDISVLTSESVPFDAGSDDESVDIYNKEMSAEELELLEKMKEALRTGSLADLGTIQKENFDRLKNKNFGSGALIELTIMEHNIRYDDDGSDPMDTSTPDASKVKAEERRRKMQVKMMTMLQKEQLSKVMTTFDFSELATFKTNTEKEIRLLRSFSALRALKHYYDGGNFMDILTTHRDIIDRTILAKGGWKVAMEEVKDNTMKLDAATLENTDHWPDFFRVKVLEYYKRALLSQQDRFQLAMDLFQKKSLEKAKRDAERLDEQKQLTAQAVQDLEELKNKKKRPLRAKTASREKAAAAAATAADRDSATPALTADGSGDGAAAAAAGEEDTKNPLELSAPRPASPGTPEREKAAQALRDMGLDSRPGSSSGEGEARGDNDNSNIPVSVSGMGDSMPGTAADPTGGAFAGMDMVPQEDLLADRVVQDGADVSVVNKGAMLLKKHSSLMNVLKMQQQQEAEENALKQLQEQSTVPLTPESTIALRLHRAADRLVLRVLGGDDHAPVVMELLMQCIDDWKVGFVSDAVEPVEEAIALCASGTGADAEEAGALCADVMELLQMDIACPKEAVDLHDKFEGIIEYLEKKQEAEEAAIAEEGDDEGEDSELVAANSGGTSAAVGTVGANLSAQVKALLKEKEAMTREVDSLRALTEPGARSDTPVRNEPTQMYIDEEITIAAKKGELEKERKRLEADIETLKFERVEFTERRNDLVQYRMDTVLWQGKLNAQEKDMELEKEEMENDRAFMEQEKISIKKQLESLAAMKDDPVIVKTSAVAQAAHQHVAKVTKQMSTKDKADAMIAAADSMLEETEKQRTEFEEHVQDQVRKIRAEKQDIAKEKIMQFKFKSDLLKKQNAVHKDRGILDADIKAFEAKKVSETADLERAKYDFDAYRANEEKILAEAKEAAKAKEDGTASKPKASLLGGLLGKAGGGSEGGTLSQSLSEVTSASTVAAKLGMKRKQIKADREEKERIDKIVAQKVDAQLEVRLAQAMATMQPDQVEVGTQTMPPPLAQHPTMAAAELSPIALNAASGSGGGGGDDTATAASSFAPIPSRGSSPGRAPSPTGGDGESGEFSGAMMQVPSAVSPAPPVLSIDSLSMMGGSGNGGSLGGLSVEDFLKQQHAMESSLLGHSKGGALSPPPLLPPGFILVHCEDGVLEVCPGVTYASYGLLQPWELEKVPSRVMYARRGEGEAFKGGIKRLPRYVKCPRIKTAEAVLVPEEGVMVVPGVRLIINSTLMTPHMELPPDVLVACVEVDTHLPAGMTKVELEPEMHVDAATWPVPSGLDLVQCNFSVIVPPGTHIAKGCVVISPPPHAPPLPRNLLLIRRTDKKIPIPHFLIPTVTMPRGATDLFLDARMAECCEIVKKPFGIRLGPGMELLRRPAGHALPAGMRLVPLAAYPEALRANPGIVASMHAHGIELVRLPCRIDLPDSTCFDDCWYAHPRPRDMRLPSGVGLFAYYGAQGGNGSAGLLPACLHAVPMPDVPYGVTIPPNVLAAELVHNGPCFLPPGVRLSPTLVVEDLAVLNPSAAAKKDPKLAESVITSNSMHFEFNEHLVLLRRAKPVVSSGPKGLSQAEVDRIWEHESKKLPMHTIRVGAQDYPTGILLEESNEMLALHVRYEVPPGVKLGAGVVLGMHTQLAPGSVLSNDLTVMERPYGVSLDPHQELVKVSPGAAMPPGYKKVVMTAMQMAKLGIPEDLMVVTLPHHVHVASNQQLSEKICAVDVSMEASRRKMKTDMMIANGSLPPNNPNIFSDMVKAPHLVGLMPGTILTRKQNKSCPLPNGLRTVPRNSLSHSTRRFLASNPGGNAVDRNASSITTSVEVCALDKCINGFPISGVALAEGLTTLEKPWWLQMSTSTQWVEVVSKEALRRAPLDWQHREVVLRTEEIVGVNETAGSGAVSMSHAMKDVLFDIAGDDTVGESAGADEDAILASVVGGDAEIHKKEEEQAQTHYALPEGTTLVAMPANFNLFGWGPNAPGLEAVNTQKLLANSTEKRADGDAKPGDNDFEGDAVDGVEEAKNAAPVRPSGDVMGMAALPSGHFYVERSRGHPLPVGVRAGLAAQYEARTHYYRSLPPGVSIVHVEPQYHLPRGISLESTRPLCPLPLFSPDKKEEEGEEDDFIEDPHALTKEQKAKLAERRLREEQRRVKHEGEKARLLREPHSSFNGHPLCAQPQLERGQPLGSGVRVLPHPPKWCSSSNPFVYFTQEKEEDKSSYFEGSTPPKPSSSCLVFALLNTAECYTLPKGCTVHPDSEKAVQTYYPHLRDDPTVDIALLCLPTELPPPRELLRELGERPVTTPADKKCKKKRKKVNADGSSLTTTSSRPTTGAAAAAADNDNDDNEEEVEDLVTRVKRSNATGERVSINLNLRNPKVRETEPAAVPPPCAEGEDGTAAGDDGQEVPTAADLEKPPQEEEEDAEEVVNKAQTEFYSKLDAEVEAGVTKATGGGGGGDDDESKPPEQAEDPDEPSSTVRICRHCGRNPHRYLAEGEEVPGDEEDKWERDAEGNLVMDDDGNLIPQQYIALPVRRVLIEQLESCSDEIHELEVENNNLRVEIKDLKYDRTRKIRRLAIFAFRQQNRDRNFLVLRNEISDLKAEIVKRAEMVKIKVAEVRDIKGQKRDLQVRMQAQIDVLNRQVAHWADVGEDVKRERVAMLENMDAKKALHEQQMTDLYRKMKLQTTQFLQMVVANMCYLAANLYRDGRTNAAIALDHLVPLRQLTEMAQTANRSAYPNQQQPQQHPFSLDDGASVGSMSQLSVSVEGPGNASLASVGAGSSTKGQQQQHKQGGGSVIRPVPKRAQQQEQQQQFRPTSGDSVASNRSGEITVLSHQSELSALSALSTRTKDTTHELAGDLRAQQQSSRHMHPPPSKGFRAPVDTSHERGMPGLVQPLPPGSKSSGGIIEISTREGSVSPLGFEDPGQIDTDPADDISVLSMEESVTGKAVSPPRAAKAPQGQAIRGQLQSLLLSSQNGQSPSKQMKRKVGGGGIMPSARIDLSKRRGDAREYVGVASSFGTNKMAGGLSSSASVGSLGHLSSVVSSVAPGSAGGGSGSDLYLPDSNSLSPNKKLKPLAPRAPGAPTQTFVLASPPGSAGGGRNWYNGSSMETGPEPVMAVPINPFLSLSSQSHEEKEDSKVRTAAYTKAIARATGGEDDQQQEGDEEEKEEMGEQEGGTKRPSGALTHDQFRFKMNNEFTNIMMGLEKAVLTTNVGFINGLHPNLPPVSITDENASVGSTSSINIAVPIVPVRPHHTTGAPTPPPPEGESTADDDDNDKNASAAANAVVGSDIVLTGAVIGGGDDDSTTKAVSFVEGDVDTVDEDDAAVIALTRESAGSPAEELFSALISAVKEDVQRDSNPHRRRVNAALEDVLKENGEDQCSDDEEEGAKAQGVQRRSHAWETVSQESNEGSEAGIGDNPWTQDVKDSLRRWRRDVEKNLLTMSRTENVKYVEALGAAETEIHMMLQNRLRLERHVRDMEKTIALMQRRLDLEGRGQQVNNPADIAAREGELTRRIGDLEQEVVRLRNAQPFASTTDFMKAQGEHAQRLKTTQLALVFQAMIFAEKAAKEEARITVGSGTVEALPIKERRAIQFLVKSLRTKSKNYADRAKYAQLEMDRVLHSVLGDLEAFEKAVKGVLPKKSILQLLRWGVEKSEHTHTQE